VSGSSKLHVQIIQIDTVHVFYIPITFGRPFHEMDNVGSADDAGMSCTGFGIWIISC